MSSSKNVKFSEDSDTSGSRISSHVSSHASHRSSTRGHRRSDSESLSDPDSRASAVPEGSTYSSSNGDYARRQLQDTLKKACKERDHYKDRARELEEELNRRDKEFHQLEAQLRGVQEHNELLDTDKKKLFKEKKALQEDNKALLDENARLIDRVERLEKKLNRASGPPPSPVSIPDRSSTKVHRSSSRSARRPSEAEQAEINKARLSKRFDRSDGSSDGRSDGTSKTERQRRQSTTTYIEPMGPPKARPMATAPMPPSPSRQQYTTSPPYADVQYAMREPPVMASVPRSSVMSSSSSSRHQGSSARPSVLVQSPRYDAQSPYHPGEDGGYFPHPLPRDRGR